MFVLHKSNPWSLRGPEDYMGKLGVLLSSDTHTWTPEAAADIAAPCPVTQWGGLLLPLHKNTSTLVT